MTLAEAVTTLKHDMVTFIRPVGWRGKGIAFHPYNDGSLALIPARTNDAAWVPKVSEILSNWETTDMTTISREIVEDGGILKDPCRCGKNEAADPHPCPYHEDPADPGSSSCTCCSECESECVMDN